MLQPGLEPGECPNDATCGRATRLTPDEAIDLMRVRQVQREDQEHRRRRAQQTDEQRQAVWRTTRRAIALELLRRRGCPQTVQQDIPDDTFEQLVGTTAQLQAQLARFEGTYIPPEGTIAHRYWVHRGYASYPDNKLMALSAIFPAVEQDQREHTSIIHLSHDDDPRHMEVRKGVTRMHRLMAIRSLLQVAQNALAKAIAMAEASVEPSWAESGGQASSRSSSENNR